MPGALQQKSIGWLPCTGTVPAAVPSLRQRGVPAVGLKARKKSWLPTAVISRGWEPLEPGLMSLTSVVPAAVPSVRQSSSPSSPLAWK